MKGQVKGKKAIALLLSMLLIFSSMSLIPGIAAAAATSEMLDIGFGGSFSTQTGYTAATGEKMFGSINRRTGNEQITSEGVSLAGGSNGVEFVSASPFGTTTVDKALIVEAQFKPQPGQNALATLLAVNNNMFVRYQSVTTLEYGFSVNNNNKWTDFKGTANAPQAGKEHAIAIAYEPTAAGAVLRVFLNGTELPSVISTIGRAAGANTNGKVGFGNDVHPAALNRGFKGTISRAIVTSFEGVFQTSMLKNMELSRMNRSLSSLGLGTLANTSYTPSQDEIVQGAIQVHGGQITGLGRLNMSGNNSRIEFTPAAPVVHNGVLAQDYAAEIVADPASIKSGSVLIDMAGAVQLRRSAGDVLEIWAGNELKGSIDIAGKLTGEFVHLSLFYDDKGDHTAEASVWLGQQQLGSPVALAARPSAGGSSIVYASGAMAGEVYGVAFSGVEGKFRADLLGLLGGPCVIPTDLQPGHRVSIRPNECSAALAAKASLVRPTPRQVQWQQYEQTAFLHYGINTYYGVEWGNFNEDPNMFQPTELDTDQWARTLKETGFKMAILTVKHHDGFALYPTRYTDFSVASSSWRDGKGNVLREFVNSMKKYGIKVGVYLSPADHGAYTDGIFANGSPRSMRTIPTLVANDDRAGNSNLPTFQLPATDYGAMLLNQLYEVLTEYGEIDEVWFDGAQGHIPSNKSEKYDWDSYYSLIRALAPQAVIAVTGEDVRWVGNESGRARENEWSVLGAKTLADGRQAYHPSYSSPDIGSRTALASAAANGMEYLTWWPSEVDVSIRPGWFYHANQQPKSVNELRNIYYQSIARNSVLLLNIPPDKRGKFADVDVARLKDWHQQMRRDFAINHTLGAQASAENGAAGSNAQAVIDGLYDTAWQSASKEVSSLTFDLGRSATVDKVVLQEDIRHGQQAESFAIEVRNASGDWQQIATSGVIGYKRVVQLSSAVTGQHFRVRILGSRGPVTLSEVGLYQTLPQGQAMAQLTGMDAASTEEAISLSYGLSELPSAMPQGVYQQDITVQYDASAVEFVSAEAMHSSRVSVLSVDSSTSGQLRVKVQGADASQLMVKGEQVLQLNWKVRGSAKLGQTKIAVSAVKVTGNGTEAQAVGTGHVLNIKARVGPIVDKAEMTALIGLSQAVHDAAVEGTQPGQYPAGLKQELAAAIAAAIEVEQSGSATQEQVDAAEAALQAALDAFKSAIIRDQALTAALTGPQTVRAGESFTVRFGINNVQQHAYAQDIAITYDADVLEYVSAASLIEGVQLVEAVSSTPGKIRLIVASAGTEHAVTGNTEVLELIFKAKEFAEFASGLIETSSVTLGSENGEEETAVPASISIAITTVKPGIPGDVNGDGKVSIGDLGIIAANYGKDSSSPDWQQIKQADLSGNGSIDLADLAAVAARILN